VNKLSYKTVFVNKFTASHNWYIIDAEDVILGRLATRVANMVRGKTKTDFTPHANSGDKVIVLNASKVRLTGNKMNDKQYIRHTGYPGGQRIQTPKQILEKKPEELLRKAVKGMLPKNKLQKEYLKNLFIYSGNEHPHEAQKPVQIEI
jgi:large subunit ribosomal protein L13